MLLIHGKKDKLINESHSVALQNQMKNCISDLFLSVNMTHNAYDFCNDLIKPLLKFISNKIMVDPMRENNRSYELDEKFRIN